MTPAPTKIDLAHAESLQDRERGRLELEAALRRTNNALAAEVLELRERVAELEAEDRDFKALARRCEEAERLLSSMDDSTRKICEEHDAERVTLKQQLAEATVKLHRSAVESADFWKAKAERYEQVTADVLEARPTGWIGRTTLQLVDLCDDNGVMMDREARVLARQLRDVIAFARKVSVENERLKADRGERAKELEQRLADCVAAMETWGSWEDGVPEGGPGNGEHERVGNAYDMACATLGYADDGKRHAWAIKAIDAATQETAPNPKPAAVKLPIPHDGDGKVYAPKPETAGEERRVGMSHHDACELVAAGGIVSDRDGDQWRRGAKGKLQALLSSRGDSTWQDDPRATLPRSYEPYAAVPSPTPAAEQQEGQS